MKVEREQMPILTYPDTLPLPPPFRISLLFLDITLAFVSLNLALIYINKYMTLKDSLKGTKLHLAWFSLFSGLGITFIIYVVGDFFSTSIEQRLEIFRYAYIVGGIGDFFFIYFIEKLSYISKNRIFTKILLVLLITLVFLNFLADFFADYLDIGIIIQAFTTSFWVPNLGLTIRYFLKVNRESLGKFKTQTIVMLVGFIMLILGMMGATDVMTRYVGLGFRTAADILTICAMLTLAFFSLKIPSWNELDWRDSIYSLYFIYKGGIITYSYDFKEYAEKEGLTAGLTAGALESSKLILDGVLKEGELKVIDSQDKKIYYEPGLYITTVIIADAQLESLEILAQKISDEFESFFADNLPTWDGDNAIFLPARALIEEIFS
ncbi:MAG: hypothetical protein ACFFCS_07910 [Candidatus Hodarchaeota archaeon]